MSRITELFDRSVVDEGHMRHLGTASRDWLTGEADPPLLRGVGFADYARGTRDSVELFTSTGRGIGRVSRSRACILGTKSKKTELSTKTLFFDGISEIQFTVYGSGTANIEGYKGPTDGSITLSIQDYLTSLKSLTDHEAMSLLAYSIMFNMMHN